ncbi:biliverdin-producing heme oxygenase [Arcobacter sp. LA11]|uniref:biliverdin-producing heme oxygenase n=1 Tax=Arcobacter sp. LA11 TaxID=1898176 RepID=UPI000933C3EA|nr:biliverdin-producing heme oxygenase [Arcobacter sp. LA11]
MKIGLKSHLKNTTKPLHDWLEFSTIFNEIKDNNLTKERYIFLLIKLYQFIKILEPKIKSFEKQFQENGLLDIKERLEKQLWLEEDLKSFDISLDTNNEKLEFNTLNNLDSIAGALYVLEGSTMGGLQIVKIMTTNFDKDIPLRYYKSYNENTMPMWMSYSNWLDNTNINEYEATLGASEVFIALKKHIDS